jgi:TolB protein
MLIAAARLTPLLALLCALLVGGAYALGGALPPGLELLYQAYDRQTTRVYRADIARGRVVELRTGMPGSGYAWSPDGSRVVFASLPLSSADLYTMDAEGGALRRLTDSAVADYNPVWSPDGARIAYVRYQQDVFGVTDLMILTPDDAAAPRRVTDISASFPAWSPDGHQLAFSAFQGAYWQIQVVDVVSGERRSIAPALNGSSRFAWSPNGSRAVFVGIQEPMPGVFQSDIYLVNAERLDHPVALTDSIGEDDAPAWSPDGTRIAFSSVRFVTADLYVMGAAPDAEPVRLTTSPANDHAPVWSPDGAWLAYSSGDGELSEIYVLHVETRRLIRVTDNRVTDFAPQWRPPDR